MWVHLCIGNRYFDINLEYSYSQPCWSLKKNFPSLTGPLGSTLLCKVCITVTQPSYNIYLGNAAGPSNLLQSFFSMPTTFCWKFSKRTCKRGLGLLKHHNSLEGHSFARENPWQISPHTKTKKKPASTPALSSQERDTTGAPENSMGQASLSVLQGIMFSETSWQEKRPHRDSSSTPKLCLILHFQ